MTIRPNALKGMIQAEMAADAHFEQMNAKEQAAYLRANPRSKYAEIAIKKSGKFEGKSNRLGHGGRAAAAESKGRARRRDRRLGA